MTDTSTVWCGVARHRVIVDHGSLLSYPFPAMTGDASCTYKIAQ